MGVGTLVKSDNDGGTGPDSSALLYIHLHDKAVRGGTSEKHLHVNKQGAQRDARLSTTTATETCRYYSKDRNVFHKYDAKDTHIATSERYATLRLCVQPPARRYCTNLSRVKRR